MKEKELDMPVAEKLDILRVLLTVKPQLVPGGKLIDEGPAREPEAKVVWMAVCLDHNLVCQDKTLDGVRARFQTLAKETVALNAHLGNEPFHSCRSEVPGEHFEQWEGGVVLTRPVSLEPVPSEFRGRDDIPMRAVFRIAGG